MIIPARDYTRLRVFTCGACRKLFALENETSGTVSCAVAHGPGDCCHYGERELKSDAMATLVSALSSVTK